MMKYKILGAAVFFICFAGTGCMKSDGKRGKQLLVNARISNGRVPDLHDINSITASIIKPEMSAEEKVLAVFHLLNRYGYEAVYPTDGNNFGWRTCTTDPVKFLNMYPWGECGTYQNLTCELLTYMGIPARRIQIKDHWIPEAWYDNGWHYIDPRWGMIFYRRDGKTIASVKDLYEDSTLMTSPARKDALVYPRDSKGLKGWAKMYSFWKVLPNSKEDTTTTYKSRGDYHAMNIDLAAGDEYVISTEKEGENGFWYCPGDLGERFLSDASRRNHNTVDIPGTGPHPIANSNVSSHWTFPGFSNGRLVYTASFAPGKFPGRLSSSENIVFTASEPYIRPKKAGMPAWIIFDIASPYIIVNGVIDAKTICKNSGDSCTVSVSSDKGRSWMKVLPDSTGRIDITKGIYGSFGYSVRFSFFAKESIANAGLCSLKITSIFQSSPLSVPRLLSGSNIITFRVDDPEVMKTISPAIEYCWTEKDSLSGQRVERTDRQIISPGKAEYEIKCGEEPVTRYVKIVVPY